MTPAPTPIIQAVAEQTNDAVDLPRYDREAIRTGIMHFGVGGFHRAHQAMYLDRLLREGLVWDWGICGVGLLPVDQRMRDVMLAQNNLYSLTLKYADGGRKTSVIGSINGYLYAPDDPDAVLNKLSTPSVRIVSLTITEGGYNISDVDGRFLAETPAVAADLLPGATPSTVFGYITEALRRRREHGTPPFTIMSCDNILGNGHVAQKAIVAFASLKDAELGQWISKNVAFPNSMVDRITPVTTEADIEEVAERTHIADAWPVVSEPFVQWVLQDTFPTGRPLWEKAGVQLVEDVTPYELMKLRLLNGSHQAMAYFGTLLGYQFAHEAATDPLMRRFLVAYMKEVRPAVPPVPGVDLDAYCDELIERFSNPSIRDTLARLAADSSDRIPKWILPVVHTREIADAPIIAAITASWARYAEGIDEQGEVIDVVDCGKTERMAAARFWLQDEIGFLRNVHLFGALAEDPIFTSHYRQALRLLHAVGARETLVILLSGAETNSL
jgi:mannitol 2-dehydrogenase